MRCNAGVQATNWGLGCHACPAIRPTLDFAAQCSAQSSQLVHLGLPAQRMHPLDAEAQLVLSQLLLELLHLPQQQLQLCARAARLRRRVLCLAQLLQLAALLLHCPALSLADRLQEEHLLPGAVLRLPQLLLSRPQLRGDRLLLLIRRPQLPLQLLAVALHLRVLLLSVRQGRLFCCSRGLCLQQRELHVAATQRIGGFYLRDRQPHALAIQQTRAEPRRAAAAAGGQAAGAGGARAAGAAAGAAQGQARALADKTSRADSSRCCGG
jgi:hypothetical protein